MDHGLKVIIGFTLMIALGIGVLYFIDNATFAANTQKNGYRPVKAGAGCAATRTC